MLGACSLKLLSLRAKRSIIFWVVPGHQCLPYDTLEIDLVQQALHSLHLPPWFGAGHVAPFVTTLDVCVQAVGAGPSILDPDNLITRLSGTSSGAGRYARSCVGSQ